MEHRLSTRKKCDLPVTLYYKNIPYPFCLTINVSSDGLMLKTGNLFLPQGALVEVAMRHPYTNKKYMLSGMVIHSKKGCAGLWFDIFNDQPELLEDISYIHNEARVEQLRFQEAK